MIEHMNKLDQKMTSVDTTEDDCRGGAVST